MGLAASQGRLLLLTARKSDLEFRAQQISQSRLVLARDQEGISKKYSEATANTRYMIRQPVAGSTTGAMENVPLTGALLLAFVRGQASRGNGQDEYSVMPATGSWQTANAAMLKYLLESGKIQIQQRTESGMQRASIAGMTDITEEYNTQDDAAAKAEYDTAMLKVKIKDQQMELDLKGVETQHKAVETETESVQKVIQKNIEVSFKIFS